MARSQQGLRQVWREYLKRYSEVQAQLAQARTLLDVFDQQTAKVDKIDWGVVGTMAYLAGGLGEIVTSLHSAVDATRPAKHVVRARKQKPRR